MGRKYDQQDPHPPAPAICHLRWRQRRSSTGAAVQVSDTGRPVCYEAHAPHGATLRVYAPAEWDGTTYTYRSSLRTGWQCVVLLGDEEYRSTWWNCAAHAMLWAEEVARLPGRHTWTSQSEDEELFG